MSPARTAAETFAEWAVELDWAAVPSGAKSAALTHMLDGLGCAIAAVRFNAVPAAAGAAHHEAQPEQATIIGEGRRVATTAAALANGALVHALDFDDTHEEALVHATAAVLPAALAAGEETHASGAAVLAAAIAGYELVIRLGTAVPHGFHRRGLHATSVCGVFASAAIAAKLMGATAAQTAGALGIAGSLAAGSLEFLATGSSTKQLHPGLSAMNGIVAARLAMAGASGPSTIFEGERGLYRTLADATVDPGALTAGLGRQWEVERITIKPWPACHLSHATLEALLVDPPAPATIGRMVFDVPQAAVPIVCEPRADKLRPRTPYEAKFSLPWSAAALLIDGSLTVRTYQNVNRPDVEALAAKIECRGVAFDGPPARAPGVVTIETTDGATHTIELDERPAVSGDALRAKLVANCGPLNAAALEDAVMALEDAPDLKAVCAATDLRGAT